MPYEALHLQRTTREHFVPAVLESTEVSAVPAEVVDAKTGVEESTSCRQSSLRKWRKCFSLHSQLG